MADQYPGNVRPFRPKPKAASPSSASPRARGFSLLMYGGVGWLLWQQSLVNGQQGFNIFMLLGLVYWVFIRRNAVKTSHFLRYHYLQATLAYLLVFGFCLLAVILAQTLGSLLSLLAVPVLTPAVTVLLGTVPLWIDLAFKGLVAVVALTQGVASGLGKLTRLPVVSDNAEFWA